MVKLFESPEPYDFWEARRADLTEEGLNRLAHEMVKLALEDLLAPIYRTRANPSEQKELVKARASAYLWLFYSHRKAKPVLSMEMCCDVLDWDLAWTREQTKRIVTEFTQAVDSGLLSKRQCTELSRSLIRDVLRENRTQGGRANCKPTRRYNRKIVSGS